MRIQITPTNQKGLEMETYHLKRYHRSGPGQTNGVLTDEIKFAAKGAADANISARRKLQSSVSAMDWEKDFVTLEDDLGHVIATWLHGEAHA
jgi:hypothetical protein